MFKQKLNYEFNITAIQNLIYKLYLTIISLHFLIFTYLKTYLICQNFSSKVKKKLHKGKVRVYTFPALEHFYCTFNKVAL